MTEQQEIRIRVCVVGAGAAGLCAARHLAQNLNKFEFKVFEKTSDVGGTWVYTDKVGLDDNGLPIHSSMYKNLRTNLPKEIMHFPDFQKIMNDRSCVTHDVILNYLKNYTEYFKLCEFIEFNTDVQYIKPEISKYKSYSKNWKVRVKNIISSEVKEYIFDAIMICNGHFFNPYIPQIPGLNNFRGQVLHSHDYRKPEDYIGKTVILLGASSSGIDIAFELSDTASHVYLSHNNDRLFNLSEATSKVTEVKGIDKFVNEKFLLKDGSALNADVLLFCTGYHYIYSFLDKSCNVKVDDNYITPLYKHMINIEHPTMCFIGIPFIIIPFAVFHIQVQYFLSLLQGKISLPEKLEMMNDSKLKSAKKRHAHRLANSQWAYNDSLTSASGFENLPKYFKVGYEIWAEQRKRDLRHYKHLNLLVSDDYKTVTIVDSKQVNG